MRKIRKPRPPAKRAGRTGHPPVMWPCRLLIWLTANDQQPTTDSQIPLLHVRHFAFQERNFEILVDINLFGAQVHDLVRLA